MDSNYFIWDGSPELFNLGVISLPFKLAIPGIIAAVVMYFVSTWYLTKPKEGEIPRSKRRRKPAEGDQKQLSGLQTLGIIIGSLLTGQILFMIIPTESVISTIGPISVRWYGLMFALSFILGFYIGNKTFEHAGKPKEYPEVLFMYLIVATILGARFGHVFFYDFDYYSRNLIEIFYFWQGGLASHGAVLGVLTALWLFSKKYADIRFFWLTDRIAMPFALGGMFVRIGNFFNSEILGRETDVSWAVIFVREDLIPRHPAMLYEAALCLALFVLLVFLYRHYKNSPPEGLLTAVFMIVLFVGRFLIEYAKERQPGFDETLSFLSMGQILSIPFVLFGIWLLFKKTPKLKE